MKKPEVVIIDDSKTTIQAIANEIATNVKKLTNIGFKIKRYTSVPENIDKIKNANMYLIDYFLKGDMTGDDVARRLKEADSTGARVLITGKEHWNGDRGNGITGFVKELMGKNKSERRPFIEEQSHWIRENLFHDIVFKDETEEIGRSIDRLVKEGQITNPLRLGVVGLGRFGKETVKRAVEQPTISEVRIFSDYYLNNDPNAYKALNEVIGSDKIPDNPPRRFEELLETRPDALFIASGLPFANTKTRYKLFMETAKKLYPYFEAISKSRYRNPIIMGPNPIEPLMRLAQETGICPFQLIGANVTDSVRARKLLAKGRYLPMDLREDSIKMDVLGSHQQPIPIFSGARIKEGRIEQARYSEFRKRFTRRLRSMGKRVMKKAESIGSYGDAPQAVIEMLNDMAHMRRHPTSCWTIYDTKHGHYYTSVPVDIEYPSLRMTSRELPELDEWERDQLEGQRNKNFRLQRRLAANFLEDMETRKEIYRDKE
jgi:malate/lactate dehydrogenase